MHLSAQASEAPDRPAVVMGATGETITFRELDDRSNRFAHLLRSRGIEPGATVAIFAENHPRYLEVAWAAQRAGLYYTTINSHLGADEAAYIVDDCGAEAIVASAALAEVATRFDAGATPGVRHRLMLGGTAPGWESYDNSVAGQPTTPIADECEGDFMLYSSGTTGRPKGIRRPLTLAPMGEGPPTAVPLLQALGLGAGDRYLCPAPLYHAAPLAWSMSAQRLGATVVVMERFDPVLALELIERHGITHGQFVPTMFVRMLKLPEEVRARYDLSSLRRVVHAAAPCPVDVKRRMIEWWGPIVDEYYAATEGVGVTWVTSDEWLARPGTVGRAVMGEIHVLDEHGQELPSGDVGTIWFSGGNAFEYHNDPAKTAEAHDERGYASVGDIGHVDEDGYLFLSDRRAHLIISGGVNIYPREVEDVLIGHPKVADVGVIGVPDDEMGEQVKAVVQPADMAEAGPELEAELLAWCRSHLAGYKCPRSVDFDPALPRLDTGKLYKRVLQDRYRTPSAGSLDR
jgi:long-chain acyl-CoA synthetase